MNVIGKDQERINARICMVITRAKKINEKECQKEIDRRHDTDARL